MARPRRHRRPWWASQPGPSAAERVARPAPGLQHPDLSACLNLMAAAVMHTRAGHHVVILAAQPTPRMLTRAPETPNART